MHALIVEDQPLVALLIEDELCELGFTSFDIVRTQEDAIAAAARTCPDFIVASVRLESGCGTEAVRRICAQQAIPTVYIDADPGEVLKAIGKCIIVAKPFLRADLHRAVQTAMLSCSGSNRTT